MGNPTTYATVPRLWPGETVVCICCGPSLTPEDVAYVRGKARVIVVNDAYNYAPWADVLYACDGKWWMWELTGKKPAAFAHNGLNGLKFAGLKYALTAKGYPGVQVLHNTGKDGLETRPTGLRHGENSGYQALNLAVHFGVSRIILLGYDMQLSGKKRHCFGDQHQPSNPNFSKWVHHFTKLAPLLKHHGVDVVNCTKKSALKCFHRADLRQVLPESLAVAS